MTVILGVCSLAVDWRHVLVAKAELQMASDAAAHNAFVGLRKDASTAQANAVDAADDNKVDGSPVLLTLSEDVEFGK